MEENIVILIDKQTQQVVLGRKEELLHDSYAFKLSDYFEMRFVQTGPKTMSPEAFDYPIPFLEGLVNGNARNKDLILETKNFYIYDFNDLKKETIDFYRAVMAKRKVGIVLTKEMPKSNGQIQI